MNCACGNAARYVDETGAFTCAICPIGQGRDSIRLADVPALLAWARAYLASGDAPRVDREELSSIIGRLPR